MSIYNKSGVYVIENLVNGKVYIGSSKNLGMRKITHFSMLKGKYHHSIILQRAYDKYGRENLKFDVLEFCEEGNRIEREQNWLDHFYDKENCYNILDSAENPKTTLGRVWTDEEKEDQRQRALARKFKHSEETVEAMRGRLSDWKYNPMSKQKYRRKISDKRRTYTDDEAIQVAEMRNQNISYQKIANHFGWKSSSVAYNALKYHDKYLT